MVIGATPLVDLLLVCLVVGTSARRLLLLVGLTIGAGALAAVLPVNLIIGATTRVPFGAIHGILRPSCPPLCVVSVRVCCFLRHALCPSNCCATSRLPTADDVRGRAGGGPAPVSGRKEGRTGLRHAAGVASP